MEVVTRSTVVVPGVSVEFPLFGRVETVVVFSADVLITIISINVRPERDGVVVKILEMLL